MNKSMSVQQAVSDIGNGASIMVGGFGGVGTSTTIIDALIEKGVKNLTLITNDTAVPEFAHGKMIVNKQIKKLIGSHIGTNPETGRQMLAGELEVELVPQGTFAEKIRAGGAGLGGVLTPTGVGTLVEEGKQKLIVDGREYLLEKPLRADFAVLFAHKADKNGNLVFRRASRNFNPMMALAADKVLVEVEELVEVGEIDPDEVMVPGVVVDRIVLKGGTSI